MARDRGDRLRDAAVRDTRARWRGGLFWTFCLSVFSCLALCLAYVLALSQNATFSDLTACRPDGEFSLESYDYNYWDTSGFFQITLGFGALEFSQAKAVDVVWDVVSFSDGFQYSILQRGKCTDEGKGRGSRWTGPVGFDLVACLRQIRYDIYGQWTDHLCHVSYGVSAQ